MTLRYTKKGTTLCDLLQKVEALLQFKNRPEVSRVEKGKPTVSIGIYVRILYALQLEDDILLLAKDDAMGKALQDLRLTQRKKASKKE